MRSGFRWLVSLAVLVVACSGAATTAATDDSTTSSSSSSSSTSIPTGTSSTRAVPTSTPSEGSPTTSTTTAIPTTSSPVVATTDAIPTEWSAAVVIRVVDGDTIDIRLDSGSTDVVRLIGTNSPERGECFADEAAAGLAALVGGETVYLEPDVTDRDQFGRLLRYVWTADQHLVNEIVVEEGWALARRYPPDTTRSDELESAQDRASGAGAGLWAADACGTAIPADVQITDVVYDAEGDDNFNLNGEWVEMFNADDIPVDLTGWVLKDESASHRYSFPVGFTLQPGASARVYTGCGNDTGQTLYWCMTGSAVWNNSGDTAFLLDPDGNIVYSFSYG